MLMLKYIRPQAVALNTIGFKIIKKSNYPQKNNDEVILINNFKTTIINVVHIKQSSLTLKGVGI